MTLRSPAVAMLWEIWRVTRAEIAWKFALPTAGGLAVMGMAAVLAPTDAATYQDVNDLAAAFALFLIVAPHLAGWLSAGKLSGGQAGFPFYRSYVRPVRTALLAGLPMAYLIVASAGGYLASAIALRFASGHAFPLLPVAAWIVGLNALVLAASWSTRKGIIPMMVVVVATTKAFLIAMDRLTAVEVPDTFDWPPRLWPVLFDFPRTDYLWVAFIALASFAVTLVMVARQRRGDDRIAITWSPGSGLRDRLIDLFRFPCPTSSATRAQLWLDLKSDGLPVLTIGLALAGVILLVSAVSNHLDAALPDDLRAALSCPNTDCFYVRPMPILFTPMSLAIVLFLGGNAFGIRRRQGRTLIGAFGAAQAYGTAQLAALKLFVKSACVLAAVVALAASAWVSVALLGDAVFLQMWSVPLSSQRSVVGNAIGAMAAYEQLSLLVVAAASVVVWVAAFAVFGALRARYSRRVHITLASLVVYALSLVLLALARERGIGPEIPLDAILRATSWAITSAMVLATLYIFRSVLAEQLLTLRQAFGVVLIAAAFGVAWATVLRAAGVPLADLPVADAVRMLSPALMVLTLSVLAPWSYSRIRHT